MPNFIVRRAFAAAIISAGLGCSPLAAQFQNPIQAAKDAYNKAKADNAEAQKQQQQQQRGVPAQSQPQGQRQTPGGGAQGAAPVAGGDCCSPDALKKIAASVGFVDIVGIKLGMTPEQAIAAIKAYKPSLKVEVLNTRVEHPSAPGTYVRVPHYISAQETRAPGKGYEYITIEFAMPPSPPLVYQVSRYVLFTPGQSVAASTLVDALVKKYGQDNLFGSADRVWVYDTNGKLLSKVSNEQSICSTDWEGPLGTGEPQRDYNSVSLTTSIPSSSDFTPVCAPLVVVNARPLGEVTAPNTQLPQMWVTMTSGGLKYGANKAFHDSLQAENDNKAKKDEDAAKSRNAPTL
jgi:hypothetical protein